MDIGIFKRLLRAAMTVTNDSAAVRELGEIITSSIASGSAIGLTSTVTANITSISLTPGDWDVFGAVDFRPAVATTTTSLQGGTSQVSATAGAQDTGFSLPFAIPASSADVTCPVPEVRISLASTTTVYLVATATFAVSTISAYGTITARRRR